MNNRLSHNSTHWVRNDSLISYKPLICALQTNGLQHTKLSFTTYKAIVYSIQSYRLHRLNLWFMLRPIPTLPQGKGALDDCESLIENCEL